jgi:hypothetical protein
MEKYQISINSNIATEEIILAGKYDEVHPLVKNWSGYTKNINTENSLTVELLQIDTNAQFGGISFKDILMFLEQKGYRAATIQELIIFGAQYSKQPLSRIHALGTCWVGSITSEYHVPGMLYWSAKHHYYTACLETQENKRELGVWCKDNNYPKQHYYAVIKLN